jgi:superfamily II DNA or RNA helicase
MTLTPYDWQKRLVRIYRGKGVIKAFAGTGKTYASILLLKDRGYKKVIVAVPTRKLKNQWKEELEKYGLKSVTVETFHILSKERSRRLKCELLIVDECHRSTSPVFRRLYENITNENILGLSATPNKASLEFCGDVIINVPLGDAQICDFLVYFHPVDLSIDERLLYDEYSEAIRRYLGRLRSSDNGEDADLRRKLDSIIFKRRSLVYSAEERIPKAVKLLKENMDKPTLVICKRIEQANIISKITGLPVYHSESVDEKALDDFQNDRISALLSVGMLAEGYDKRNIKCLIIVSTAITEAYHIQSIGRAVRLPDDAYIHILLARKTTDEKLLQFRKMYNHKLVGEFSSGALKSRNPWIEQFYISDEYSIDPQGRIFKKTDNGKHYYKGNILTAELEKLFDYRGGKFRITNENFVLAKRRGKIIPLGMLHEPLEMIKPTKVKHLRK